MRSKTRWPRSDTARAPSASRRASASTSAPATNALSPGAGQHDAAHRRVGGELRERAVELLDRAHVERVALLLPVHGDEADPVPYVDEKVLVRQARSPRRVPRSPRSRDRLGAGAPTGTRRAGRRPTRSRGSHYSTALRVDLAERGGIVSAHARSRTRGRTAGRARPRLLRQRLGQPVRERLADACALARRVDPVRQLLVRVRARAARDPRDRPRRHDRRASHELRGRRQALRLRPGRAVARPQPRRRHPHRGRRRGREPRRSTSSTCRARSRRCSRPAGACSFVDWSPDNSFLIYTANDAGGREDLFFSNIDGTSEQNLTNTADVRERQPRVDPGARTAAYERIDVERSAAHLHLPGHAAHVRPGDRAGAAGHAVRRRQRRRPRVVARLGVRGVPPPHRHRQRRPRDVGPA